MTAGVGSAGGEAGSAKDHDGPGHADDASSAKAAGSLTAPSICWYGDDFTGATDTLAEVARAGLRGLLFLGVPTPEQLRRAGPLDAIGIAGAARAMPPTDMETELRSVGRFMAGTGARVLHYKCCSTFDSAPHVGSIGVAIRELRRHMPNRLVPIVGGQPSIGRYCSFAQLFARAGAAPEVYRIDRHPVMSQHPVTPMHEADLRRHLAAQGLEGIRSVPHIAYPRLRGAGDAGASGAMGASGATGASGAMGAVGANDVAQLDAWIDDLINTSDGPVLFDVTGDEQLAVIGRLIWRAAASAPLLAVGPSSVQQALARAAAFERDASVFQRDKAVAGPDGHAAAHGGKMAARDATTSLLSGVVPLAPASGPVLVMAGSLSPVTARQISASTRYKHQPLQVQALLASPAYVAEQIQSAVAALAQGHNVLVHTDRPEQAVTSDEAASTARATAQLAAAIITASAQAGTRLARVGIAGGDTSSQATLALGLWGLQFRCVLAPGVTVSVARSDNPVVDGVELMLKGGQMGGDDLFDRLVVGVG
ncbi:four-carbon acid sugar kinase family protein [Achromobacter sp. B7]|uniref:four-carbon acid sugar kinase family protein n=1 Tax=Achromobacter sp. B7 TaxID=2282475 RepID=UPI000E75E292|nr:four-carbon acid sugar kinase family protein [Achromobacter sp. B7]AYD65189.1 four-carbon acid sugar kinase family protein [Achromobacter sp. B7]